MNPIIGIDLGTTYSAAARLDADGRPVIIPNAEGEAITPSVVWFGSDPPTVGRLAKDEQQAGATDVIAFFKRNMGDDSFRVEYGGRSYSPIDLSALVLSKIKSDCEAALKLPVRDAVVTVPAYFTNTQREATIEAGRRAGLNVLRIINEPTAAALAYGLHQTGREEIVLVYDLGGGTFDVTLVRLTATDIEVLATDGNHQLGGKDWDERILGFFASRFREEHHDDPLAGSAPMGEWMYECERYKRQLSGVNSVKVAFAYEGQKGNYELTREKFAEITADLVDSTGRLIDKVLAECQPPMSWEQLSGVLLVGGSTRMPMIHEYLRQKSGKPPRGGIEVDHAVALGAAIQAGLIARERQIRDNPTMKPDEGLIIASSRKNVRDVMGHSLGLITRASAH
jgi:molecular chaperone DnaK